MTFPECDFFCQRVGRLSVFPSTCDGAEELFADDCTCAEAPVKNGAACLKSICTSQQFGNLVAAERARCGAGSVPAARSVPNKEELMPGRVTSLDWRHEPVSIVRRRDLSLSPKPTEGVLVQSDNTFHVRCGDSVTDTLASLFMLLPLVIALLAIMTAVVAYRRRRAAQIKLGESIIHAFEEKGQAHTA